MFSVGSEDNLDADGAISALQSKKLIITTALLFMGIIFVASTIIYFYYQSTLEKHHQTILEAVENKKNYIDLILDHSNHDSFSENDLVLHNLLQIKTNFYKFGELIDVVYLNPRPDGDFYLFSMEGHDNYPVREIVSYDELSDFHKKILKEQAGTGFEEDYSSQHVLEAYAHLDNLNLYIFAKKDLERIQAPFIRDVLIILGITIFCYVICILIFIRVNQTYISKIKKSATRTNELVNTSSNVIYTLDYLDFKPTYTSENVVDMTGYTSKELTGDTSFWLKHVHPDDLIKIKTELTTLYIEGEVLLEYRLRRKDNKYIWIQDRTRLLKYRNGEPSEIIGSWVDVTHIKQSASILKDQKDYFKNLLQNLSSPMFIVDPNHIVLFWNKACEELSGLPAENVIGTNKHWRGFYRIERPCLCDVYIDNLNASPLYINAKKSKLNEERLHAENWCTVYGGRRLYLAIDVGPIFDKEGNLVAVVENLRDLTEHRTLQTELIDSRDIALEAANIRSQFLANMSHEIRTPMNGVLGMLDLIKQTSLTKQQKEYTNTAYYSAESLLEIINDILDYTKIDSGYLELEIIRVNLHKLIVDIDKLFSYKAEEKGIKFIVSIADDVPHHIFGDPTRVRQILINLIGNAIKFTKKGNVKVKIKLYKQIEDNIYIQFNIEDTGIGIPIEKQEKLFDNFSQVDASTTRKFGGTGLGLAITKRLLELMSGKVKVQSEEGIGTCFTIEIPFEISEKEDSHDEISNVVSLPDKENIELRNLSHTRILLAEDNKVNKKVTLAMLRHIALTANVVDNGKQAIDEVKQGNYDLVLMDCQMPIMSGYEATKLIRQYEKEEKKDRIVIIAMTANAMQGDKEECLAVGMDDYISKPVDKEILGEKISQWMGENNIKNNEVYSMKNNTNEDVLPLIDTAALDGLQSIMEDEYTEVLEIYLEESINLMSDIHTAFEEESDKLIRYVHTLKSSSNNVGAKRLGTIAEKMETLLIDNNVESAKAYLVELQDVFEQSHALIKKYAQCELQEAAI